MRHARLKLSAFLAHPTAPASSAHSFVTVTVGSDGLGLIGYDNTSRNLEVVHLSNLPCVPSTSGTKPERRSLARSRRRRPLGHRRPRVSAAPNAHEAHRDEPRPRTGSSASAHRLRRVAARGPIAGPATHCDSRACTPGRRSAQVMARRLLSKALNTIIHPTSARFRPKVTP